MLFKSYVPAGARSHIVRTLEGDGGNWQGILAFIAEFRANGCVNEAADGLEQEAECLERFAKDPRMRAVYSELQKMFSNDDQYARFLGAAWRAKMDYGQFRARLIKAKNLALKITKSARELAQLIKQVPGDDCPAEFYSIRTLLDETENHELDDHNLYIWRAVRGAITGKRREVPPMPTAAEADAKPKQVIIVRESDDLDEVRRNHPDALLLILTTVPPGEGTIDTEEQARNYLAYAWEKAPNLSSILKTVARAADSWAPSEAGAIGAAISSRKRNPATEYVRAFATLLRDEHQFALTGRILFAVAGTANVVLNDPEVSLSADDVRKAIAFLPEDST